MFKDEYRRMNDDIRASEALIRQTLSAAKKARKPARLVPALAASVCLLALLLLPRLTLPGAASDVTAQDTTPSPAAAFTPIGHSTEVDGMTLRYLSSCGANGSAYILLSLEGEAVSEDMSLTFALTSEKTGQTFWLGAYQLNHDAERQLSTFMLEIHDAVLPEYTPIVLKGDGWSFPSEAWDPTRFAKIPADDRLTLTLISYKHILFDQLGDTLPLESLPTDVTTISRTVDEVITQPYWADIEYRQDAPDSQKTVLQSGEPLCEPFEGFQIVGAGFDGEQLRIQTCIDLTETAADGRESLGAYLYLVPRSFPDRPWESIGIWEGIYAPSALCAWTDEETNESYRDYRYDVSREELLPPNAGGWQLYALGFRTVNLQDASHTLTFTIGE